MLLKKLNITPSGKENEIAQFDKLWMASFVSAVLPVVSIALLPFCIPNRSQTDRLIEVDDISAVKGSLWRQWTCKEGDDTSGFLVPEEHEHLIKREAAMDNANESTVDEFTLNRQVSHFSGAGPMASSAVVSGGATFGLGGGLVRLRRQNTLSRQNSSTQNH